MEESEKIHALTDAIYKNLMDNFTPGIRQLISTGRTYQKALQNVTTAAKGYIECLYNLAQSGQVCKGATSEIGAALLQLAEIHKEINTQVIENIKSVHADLLIPMENKHESDFKHIPAAHKKYINGHKFHAVPYEKAQTVLKKHKKRAKAKFGFDQKEMMYAREVRERRMKMDDFHLHGLRQALLVERTSYCFMLDRMCSTVQSHASYHRKAHDLLTRRLFDWTNLCRNPNKLPPSSEAVIQAFHNQDAVYENTEESPETRRRQRHQELERWAMAARTSGATGEEGSLTYGMMGRDSSSLTYGYMPNGIESRHSQYAVAGLRLDSVQHPLVVGVESRQRARAMYTHTGLEETQLSFLQGDVLLLIGSQRDGWQYGENTRTLRMGWFPASFMQLINESEMEMKKSFTHERVKSLSNLAEIGYGGDYPTSGSSHPRSCDLESGQASMQRNRQRTDRPMSMYVAQSSSSQVPAYGSSKIFFPTPIPELDEKASMPSSPVSSNVIGTSATPTVLMRDNHQHHHQRSMSCIDVQSSTEILPPEQFQDRSVCSTHQPSPVPRLT